MFKAHPVVPGFILEIGMSDKNHEQAQQEQDIEVDSSVSQLVDFNRAD